tara:strand:- start:241 stop:702 length:462 start_codon:yes stop_codon:yes gene_type:complete
MKKGQTEILGIVVVVVLIVLGLLFFIKTPSKVETGNFEVIYAGNSLGVILDYVPVFSCQEKNIGDLLRDCKFECSVGDDFSNACECPCEVAKEEINAVLGKILEEGNFRGYYFSGVKYGNSFIDVDEGCKDRVGIFGPAYFVGNYEFRLKLCK